MNNANSVTPYLYINDQRVSMHNISPNLTLLRFLRDHLGLMGTKEGCAEGDCGACTVVIYEPQTATNGEASYRAINSCLLLTPALHGRRLYTVEGLVDRERGGLHSGLGRESEASPHPVQSALVDQLGSQCGYCTPGVIMSMTEACYRTDIQETWQIDDQMCGNLCRCTGYRPIQEATEQIVGLRPSGSLLDRLEHPEPSEEKVTRTVSFSYTHQDQRFYRPTSLSDLWPMWAADSEAELVAGGTDLGLRITKNFESLNALIAVDQIKELHRVEELGDGWLSVGASLPLSDVESLAKTKLPALERMLRFFGARQIKNRGTLGGNICTASPIGDTPPVLLAMGARLRLASAKGERILPVDEFFTGYRQTALEHQELVVAVEFPPPPTGVHIHQRAFKVSKRQELDISSISACFSIELSSQADGTQMVQNVKFAYGGMAATPSRAYHAEKAVLNQSWQLSTIQQAMNALSLDFTPITDHRASAWYRAEVAKNLLHGFWLEVNQATSNRLPYRPSSTVSLHSPQSQGESS